MHRLMMQSSTYQMTSRYATDEHLEHDPDNRLVWRMNRRRLEAEALWDAVHAIAGTINLKLGGPPVVPALTAEESAAMRLPWKWPESADPADHTRRGVYILTRRNFRFPMFRVFDAPINSASCPERDVTTVAPQALWSLNSASVHEQASKLAERVVQEAGDEAQSWPDRLWLVALGRPITEVERTESLELIEGLVAASDQDAPEEEALAKLCLAVYNLSEFSFVD